MNQSTLKEKLAGHIENFVHGLLAMGQFAVGQFAVKKMLVSVILG